MLPFFADWLVCCRGFLPQLFAGLADSTWKNGNTEKRFNQTTFRLYGGSTVAILGNMSAAFVTRRQKGKGK